MGPFFGIFFGNFLAFSAILGQVIWCWYSLPHLDHLPKHFRPFWAILGHFWPFWVIFGHFRVIMAIFGHLGGICVWVVWLRSVLLQRSASIPL